MTLLAPVLVLLLVFVAVVVHRAVDARLRTDSAAHQAARAASIERTGPAATVAASDTASAALDGGSASCRSLAVSTDLTGFRSGGTVAVTVTCTVDLTGSLLLGVPGRTDVTSTAVEPVDAFRSLQPAGLS